MTSESRRTTPLMVHATALAIGESGILIRGHSASGKSSLARRLIELAIAEGLFARLIGDDRIEIRVAGSRLLALPHPLIAGKIEVRGQGILPVTHENAIRLSMVIDIGNGVDRDISGCGDLPRLPEKPAFADAGAGVALPALYLQGSSSISDKAAEAMAFLKRLKSGKIK